MTTTTTTTTATDMKAWKAAPVTATTSKRCPQCHRMVNAGERAILRDGRYQATSGRTPWIGNRQSYKRGAWHLYHEACFVALVECATKLTAGGR